MFLNRDLLHDDDDEDNNQDFQLKQLAQGPNSDTSSGEDNNDKNKYQAKVLKLNQDISDDDDDDDDDDYDYNSGSQKQQVMKLADFVQDDEDSDDEDVEIKPLKLANEQKNGGNSNTNMNNWDNPEQNNIPKARIYDGIQSSHHNYEQPQKQPSKSKKGNIDDFIYGNANNFAKQGSDEFGIISPPKQATNANYSSQNGNSNGSYAFKQPTTNNDNLYSNRPGSSREKITQRLKENISQIKDNNSNLLSNNKIKEGQYSNDGNFNYYNPSSSLSNSNYYDPAFSTYNKNSELPNVKQNSVTIGYQFEEHAPIKSTVISKEEQQHSQQQNAYDEEHKKANVPQQLDSSGSPNDLEEIDDENNNDNNKHEEDNDAKKEFAKKQMQDDQDALEQRFRERQQQLNQQHQQPDEDPNANPDPPVVETKILQINLREIVDMKAFLMRPCPKGFQIQCSIKRDKSGFNRFSPKYHCYLFNGPQYLMSAKKRGFNKTSNYLISSNKSEMKKSSNHFLGKLRSNFMGTEFNIYDNGKNPKKTKDINVMREHLGVVLYESNILGARGPRKMKVLIPEVTSEGQIYQFKPQSGTSRQRNFQNITIQSCLKQQQYPQTIIISEIEVQAYVLNFNGRVEKPSVKNFQLINESDEEQIYMQFGRVNNDTFNMDFEWPLSPYQAFAISLSSFDYKLACE